REHGVRAVVDATHPFAQRISASAAHACAAAGVPLLRLERPGWTAGPGDRWHRVATLDEATAVVPSLCRLDLELSVTTTLATCTLSDSSALIAAHAIDVVVTKDSCGDLTRAKLDAARERGVPVIVVQRPPRPATRAVAGVGEALAWAARHASSSA